MAATVNPGKAAIRRVTKETEISLSLDLGGGPVSAETPSGFFDHMLTSMATHAGWGLELKATGDARVDYHHTVEDAGIVLGEALAASLGDFSAHKRFASALVPMDDALAEVALDAGRRPYLFFKATFPQPYSSDFDFCLVEEFFRALAGKAGFTLHMEGKRGNNSHHLSEALFKAFGMASKIALSPRDDGGTGPLSSKGVL
ncbi:MAG: imidazoleglycerol-phosphate dehydratase HisB [Deltaproteobacteria bacterium]|jgi:imidazoleglycerol-phosphate dehydratase|nr:imidazoleglycerol-phosphate dehydratase HisB [Deltaproteobacteria bacterium]